MREQLSYQEMVQEFMEASGQPVYDKRRELTTEEADLRYRLYQEEVEELAEAIKNDDRVEQLDALCDTLYILLGTALTKGEYVSTIVDLSMIAAHIHAIRKDEVEKFLKFLQSRGVEDYVKAIFDLSIIRAGLGFSPVTFDEAFHRVHASNMSKFCSSKEEALATVHDYHQKGIEAVFVQRGDKYVILRSSDKKVLKSINYTPVDLTDLV